MQYVCPIVSRLYSLLLDSLTDVRNEWPEPYQVDILFVNMYPRVKLALSALVTGVVPLHSLD